MFFAATPVSPVVSTFWEGHGLLDSPLLTLSPFATPERLSSPLHGLTAAAADGSASPGIDAAGLLGLFGQSPISCVVPGSPLVRPALLGNPLCTDSIVRVPDWPLGM